MAGAPAFASRPRRKGGAETPAGTASLSWKKKESCCQSTPGERQMGTGRCLQGLKEEGADL